MKRINPRTLLILSVAVFCIFVWQRPYLTNAQQPNSPEQIVQQAWEQAQASSTYDYRANLEQTTYPLPKLSNSGRTAVQDTLLIEGNVNQAEERLEMTLWQNGNTSLDAGLSIRVEAGVAYGRTGQNDWQEVNNVSDLFAPGGDPLGFLHAVTNLAEAGSETRQFGDTTLTFTQYSFEMDGPAYATYMRQKMMAQLKERGTLPIGLTIDSAEFYRQMTGQGDIWIDANGLPSRMQVAMSFPPQNENGRTEATITTDFSNYNQSNITQATTTFQGDPKTWITHRLPDAKAQSNIAAYILIWLGIMVVLLIVITHWRSRKLHSVIGLIIIFSMLFAPLLQSHHAYAFADEMNAQEAEQSVRQAEAEEIQAARDELKETNWDPHQSASDQFPVNSDQSEIIHNTS